ncbi:MAG: bis(5'-nucleosyl)-tetraphosphatase (symmetrical) YqeK [Elusimicrobiota bacterium]
MTYKKLKEQLKTLQSPARFKHSVAVGKLAKKLGKRHGWDPKLARLSGLLHDWAKEWNPKELGMYCKNNKLKIPNLDFILRVSPNILHAYVSADIALKNKWITNKKALHAIASHTLGDLTMELEDKIIYIADFSSPDRKYKEAKEVRKMAMKDLECGFRQAFAYKMTYQLIKTKPIHPLVMEVWNKVICKNS